MQALLAAGVQVFAERGYDAATTREVAQAAGVNEQLIQRYFGGKAGLLLAIIERFGEEERRNCSLPPPCAGRGRDPRGFRPPARARLRDRRLHQGRAAPLAVRSGGRRREIGRQIAETRVPLLRERLGRAPGLRPDRCEANLGRGDFRARLLSFGLAIVDQLVSGADCDRLKRVTPAKVARPTPAASPRGGTTARGSLAPSSWQLCRRIGASRLSRVAVTKSATACEPCARPSPPRSKRSKVVKTERSSVERLTT